MKHTNQAQLHLNTEQQSPTLPQTVRDELSELITDLLILLVTDNDQEQEVTNELP